MKKSRGKKAKKAKSNETQARNGIPFELFFAGCVNQGRLKSWQRDEIAAFFRDMRLRDKEEPEVFETALKRF